MGAPRSRYAAAIAVLLLLSATGGGAPDHHRKAGSGPSYLMNGASLMAADLHGPVPPRRSVVLHRPAPPERLQIGESTYSVLLVQKVPPAGEASGLAGKACDDHALKNGWCTAKGRIYLERGRTLQQERTTLLHEIQHVLLGTQTSDDEVTTHDFIYSLSPKLLQVLQDNPDLYSYLTASGPK